MGEALLGDSFDIHGGGIDLVFPHHENEIAQSECVHRGAPLAQVWMHNGFVQMAGEKMAKSEGNVVTIRELLDRYEENGLAIRYNMLRSHYRQPFDWTEDSMSQAVNELNELWLVANDFEPSEVDGGFVRALSDDLNTALARARLFELKDAARAGDPGAGSRLRETLNAYGFGGLFLKREIILPHPMPDDAANQVAIIINHQHGDVTIGQIVQWIEEAQLNGKLAADMLPMLKTINARCRVREIRHIGASEFQRFYELIAARLTARKAKDFKEADRIRDELAKMGVVLHDTKDGTTWEVAR
jgi:cysteinyl-tRNA synthetase